MTQLKTMNKDNVSLVVKEGLCCSCGVCKSACAKNAISFNYGNERNTPIIDVKACVSCGLCYDVCPGKGLNLLQRSKLLYSEQADVNYNKYCGYYLGTYIAHSNNEDIRYHSSSGGVVTQFLLYLLRNKIIDGALIVRYNVDNPLEPEPFIATKEDEILLSRGSKYLVLSYDKVIEDLEYFEGRVVVVGLPCQIHGIRMLADRKRKIRDKILAYFAIYCSLTKTKHSMDYYLWRYGLKRDDIGRFSFRDDGCLGYMKVEDKGGNIIKKVKYEKYWHGTHSFFINNRCALCIDHFGELADISFGDIHIKPYSLDTIGISSVISRNNGWNNLLKASSIAGEIELQETPVEEIIKSQPYSKRHKKGAGVKCYMQVRAILGKMNPDYAFQNDSKITIKTYLHEIVCAIMRNIGAHRIFWPVIRLFDR